MIRKVEIGLICFIGISLALWFFNLPIKNIALTIAFSSIGLFYIILGQTVILSRPVANLFKKYEIKEIDKVGLLLVQVACFMIGLTSIGILFKLMIWPGFDGQLLFGSTATLLLGIYAIFKSGSTHYHRYKRLAVRTLFFGLFGFIVIFTPSDTILDIHHPKGILNQEELVLPDSTDQ